MKARKGKFLEFYEKYRGRGFVITSHRNADIDSLCCMYALHAFFPKAVLALPGDVEEPAEGFAKELGMKWEKLSSLDPRDFEGLVVVDTSAPSLVPGGEAWRKLLIVDHHVKNGFMFEAEYEVRDEDAPSAAEIMAEILPELSQKVAFALACGIVSDSARFKGGRKLTFETFVKLMDISGKEYQEILKWGEPELTLKLKGEVLEALRNMKVQSAGSYLIASVEVKDNESLIASSISEFADVALAAKWKESEGATKVSARGRKSVGVKLNEVLAQVAREYGGAGGGHPKAAGCAAKERPDIVLRRIIELVKEKL